MNGRVLIWNTICAASAPPCTASTMGIIVVTLNPELTTRHDVAGIMCVCSSAFVMEQFRNWYGISTQLCFIVSFTGPSSYIGSKSNCDHVALLLVT